MSILVWLVVVALTASPPAPRPAPAAVEFAESEIVGECRDVRVPRGQMCPAGFVTYADVGTMYCMCDR